MRGIGSGKNRRACLNCWGINEGVDDHVIPEYGAYKMKTIWIMDRKLRQYVCRFLQIFLSDLVRLRLIQSGNTVRHSQLRTRYELICAAVCSSLLTVHSAFFPV